MREVMASITPASAVSRTLKLVAPPASTCRAAQASASSISATSAAAHAAPAAAARRNVRRLWTSFMISLPGPNGPNHFAAGGHSRAIMRHSGLKRFKIGQSNEPVLDGERLQIFSMHEEGKPKWTGTKYGREISTAR